MIDRFGREIDYMRVSVTERCNLRCVYCMPEEGIIKRSHDDMMSIEETVQAIKAAASLGIKKIRITGGEPLVRHGVLQLCSAISEIEGIEEICMTTNGTLLHDYAKDLKLAGVSHINISLDTLREDRYRQITRRGDLQDVLNGIEAVMEEGFAVIKTNTVLLQGFNDDEIPDFVRLTVDSPIEVRFIELMPIGTEAYRVIGRYMDCKKVLDAVPGLVPLGISEGVAGIYKLSGAKGRVGLIRPVSCEFCGSCNKIRLTADGMIKPCLHSEDEMSLKGKSEEEMKTILKEAIKGKPEMRETLDADNPSKAKRNMNRIGG